MRAIKECKGVLEGPPPETGRSFPIHFFYLYPPFHLLTLSFLLG